ILLDWNLPRVHGRDVLHFIKNEERLSMIPVIVLTTSKSETDIQESYDKRANCYIAKPVDIDSFFAIMRNLGQFWFNVVKLPSQQF
ncbi:MAG: response regulator, partial [Bacteroidota bacterium]